MDITKTHYIPVCNSQRDKTNILIKRLSKSLEKIILVEFLGRPIFKLSVSIQRVCIPVFWLVVSCHSSPGSTVFYRIAQVPCPIFLFRDTSRTCSCTFPNQYETTPTRNKYMPLLGLYRDFITPVSQLEET